VVFSVVIISSPPFDGDEGVLVPDKAVVEGAAILDLHNCMICTLWFSRNRLNRIAWLLWLPCRDPPLYIQPALM